MPGDLAQGHEYAHGDHHGADQAGAARQHGVTAKVGSEHLSLHHRRAN